MNSVRRSRFPRTARSAADSILTMRIQIASIKSDIDAAPNGSSPGHSATAVRAAANAGRAIEELDTHLATLLSTLIQSAAA